MDEPAAVVHAQDQRPDGAGYGWFVDNTPLDDSEFAYGTGTLLTADPTAAPAGNMDLLTTLMHEIRHELGFEDSYDAANRDDLMYGYLVTGERRLPDDEQDVLVTNAAVSDWSSIHQQDVANSGWW